jgi:hypothetical protein
VLECKLIIPRAALYSAGVRRACSICVQHLRARVICVRASFACVSLVVWSFGGQNLNLYLQRVFILVC